MVDEKKPQALTEYSKEIGPLVRAVAKKKELLKDFKESDETAVALAETVKIAQEALKAYVEASDDGKTILAEIKEAETELKTALKGAAYSTKNTPTPYKAGELKPYFVARNKEKKAQAVEKVIKKGDTFEALEKVLA